MQERVAKTKFQPSWAILPFAGVFFSISVYVIIRLFPSAPFLLIILLIPYILFLLWWFLSLFVISATLKLQFSKSGIQIQHLAGGFFDTEIISIGWEEVKDVAFSYSKEFIPATFTGRNSVLTFELQDCKKVAVEHIMTIEDYTDMFEIIQKHIPFVYELPREQLASQRMRQIISLAALVVFFVIFILFIS